MPESERIKRFGIHSLTLINRSTGEILCRPLEILGEATVDIAGETVKLFGGSSKFPWGTELTRFNGTLSANVKEYPADLVALLNGTDPTKRVAEASGAVENEAGTADEATNKTGTSCFDAVLGITAVNVKAGSVANAKTGVYYIKVVSSTTVDVYAYTNVDFAKGTDGIFVDDTAKITASPLTISAVAVEVGNFGIELTGVASPNMVIGDTAVFIVRKVNEGSFKVPIGNASLEFTEFEVLLTGAKQTNGDIEYWRFYKCRFSGAPFPLPEADYGTSEMTIDLLFDSAKGKVGDLEILTETVD